jgi:tetratricopeptide (TPR) repeat protein
LRIDPQNLLAREGVRRTQSRNSGTVQRTLEGLKLQVTTNPNDQGLLLRYAHALYDARQFRQAAQYYDQYLQRGQPVPDIVHRYLISIASYEGDNNRGEQAAERFLSLYPSDSNLHMRLGYFRLWQGKRQTAQSAFAEAIRLNANNREAQQGLAQTHQQTQAAPAAGPVEFIVDRLMRELKSEPENDEKRFDLIHQLIRYDRFFEAYDQLVLLAERHDTSERWLDLLTRVDADLTRTAGALPIVCSSGCVMLRMI